MTTSWAEQVLALGATFGRAPSAHNTQPAAAFVEGGAADGDAVVVGWDPTRELTVGDPTRRDLWLSLGAFVESVSIAAADAGPGVHVAWDVDTRAHRVARLTPHLPDSEVSQSGEGRHPQNSGTSESGSEQARAFTGAELLSRRTARGPYVEPVVTAEQVTAVETAAGAHRTSQAAERPRLHVVDPALVDELLPTADRWGYGSSAQVAELRHWLRLDRDDPGYRLDGLTYEALAMTPFQARALRVLLSRKTWPVLSRLGGAGLLARSSRIEGRGTVVAFSARRGEAERPEQIGEHGRTLLRTWLAAQRLGLHVHPLSVLIDAPATAPRLHAAVSGDGDERKVLSVFRIGRPVNDPVESARRSG